MTNAPKTIWVDPGLAEDLEEKSEFIEEVQYIRADIAEAMRDAMVAYMEQFPSTFGAPYRVVDDYKKAIKLLEN